MDEMIEKLKKNKKAFGLLEPEEQECFKNVRKINCLWYHGSGVNDWGSDSGAFSKFDNQTTYAIKPDYKPEPEFVDLEIRVKSDGTWRWLGVPDCAGNYDWLPHHFTHLHCLPSLPNFELFWYEDTNTIRIDLDEVAHRIHEGKTVYARFRKA